MVCLLCNLSLYRAEVGIIKEPPVRIRNRVWTACLSSNNVYIVNTIVTNLNVRAAVLYITNSRKNKQMLFIPFTCLNVGKLKNLKFAFRL